MYEMCSMKGVTGNGLSVLHQAGNVVYGLLDSEDAIDELNIEIGLSGVVGFNYFHTKFGIPYDFLLKNSIVSGHKLFVATDRSNRLIGFARFEMVSDNVEKVINGKRNIVKHSVYMLRSIEVHPSFRKMGVGRLLFSIAAEHLCSTIITKPDNQDAARFFAEKLMFEPMCSSGNLVTPRHRECQVLPYPRAILLFKQLAVTNPRMVMPELIDTYEALRFKTNMGRVVTQKDMDAFKQFLDRSEQLLDKRLSDEMHQFVDGFSMCKLV